MGSMGHMDRNASMGRTSSKLGSTSRSISSLSTSSVGSKLVRSMRQMKLALALAWPPPSLVILQLILLGKPQPWIHFSMGRRF